MQWRSAAFAGLIVAVGFTSTAASAAKDSAPPQRQLRTYELHGKPRAADISPDETLVATQVTRPEIEGDSRIRTVELAQLWDFRQDRLIAEVQLEEVTSDKRHVVHDPFIPRFVRFTADGQLVVVYLHHQLHILSRADLHEVRHIRMMGPPDVAGPGTPGSGKGETAKFSLLEVSPTEHKAVVAWRRDFRDSTQVELLDLDSGQRLGEWNAREQGLGVLHATAVAWDPGGRDLVVAVPNALRCLSPTSVQPDIFVVDAVSGKIRTQWTSGLLVGILP